MKNIKFDYKQVMVVRDDLKLSRGKLAVQVAHAAVNAVVSAKKSHILWYRKWLAEGQKKVVVRVANLEEMYELKANAESMKLPTSLITDAGLTEIEPGTVTCLGIGPAPNAIIDKITGKLKLL